MSLTFTRLVARKGKGLTRKANAVLRVLADRADTKGRSFPSQETLADDTGSSVRTIRRALDELEAAGWIDREERRRRDGTRTSDLITIRDEEAIERHVAAMLRLPLMVAIAGGQAVDKAGDIIGDNVGITRPSTGQTGRLSTGQTDRVIYHLKDSLIDHLRAGEGRARMDAPSPAPEDQAPPLPRKRA